TDHLIQRIHQLDTTYQTFYPEQRIEFYSLNNVSCSSKQYGIFCELNTMYWHSTDTYDEFILFYNGLDIPTRQILDSKGAIPTKTATDAKVGCELCKGPHYMKDCPLKEDGKTLKESYYIQFGAPYQPGGQYRAVEPGFYQWNNENSSYPDRRQTMEESLTKFMAELAKRHEENSNIIKEIRASTDAVIRNQGALIKTLEIQIGQMSKVLQERGFESLPSSTKMNPRD
ncbi:hypothetical protein Tco_1388791, partial [Tanacetum coccineum]